MADPIDSDVIVSAITFWKKVYDEMWTTKRDENLLLLRVFRGEILLNTKVGRVYVSMLYENSFEIASLLIKNQLLAKQTAKVLDELLPSIESLLSSDEMELSQDTIENLETLLNKFESKASPKLKTAIRKVEKDINERKVLKQLGIIISE